MWIDNDIEIRDDRFFDVLDMPASSAAIDLPAVRKKMPYWNAGLIVVDEDFARRWVAQLDHEQYSDQDSMPTPDHEIPRRYNELIINKDFDAKNAYAIHWVGFFKWEYLKHVRDGDRRTPAEIKRAAHITAARIRRDHLFSDKLVGKAVDLARRMHPFWDVRVDR